MKYLFTDRRCHNRCHVIDISKVEKDLDCEITGDFWSKLTRVLRIYL